VAAAGSDVGYTPLLRWPPRADSIWQLGRTGAVSVSYGVLLGGASCESDGRRSAVLLDVEGGDHRRHHDTMRSPGATPIHGAGRMISSQA